MTAGLDTEATRWTIHDERVIDDTRKTRLHIAKVELPDGVEFEQYVLRCPRAAMVLAVDEQDRVLLMWRHRTAGARSAERIGRAKTQVADSDGRVKRATPVVGAGVLSVVVVVVLVIFRRRR